MKKIITFQGTVSAVWDTGARISTKNGDVFVHPKLLAGHPMEWRSRVKGKCVESRDKGDKNRRRAPFEAEQILGVLPPANEPARAEAYGVVNNFSGMRRLGRITLIPGAHPFGATSVRFDGKVCPDDSPEKDELVKVWVEETPDGLAITAIEANARITAAAKLLQRQLETAQQSNTTRLYGTVDGGTLVAGDSTLPAVRKKRIKRPESLG